MRMQDVNQNDFSAVNGNSEVVLNNVERDNYVSELVTEAKKIAPNDIEYEEKSVDFKDYLLRFQGVNPEDFENFGRRQDRYPEYFDDDEFL